MFGGMANKIGVLAKKATGGGGGDVTPNAVNWGDIIYNGMSGNFGYTERQITGINTTITLKMESDTVDGVYVFVSNTAGAIVNGDDTSPSDPGAFGMTYLNPNDTFTVSNNQYVTFGNSGQNYSSIITIRNQSDGNAQLDTFISECIDC